MNLLRAIAAALLLGGLATLSWTLFTLRGTPPTPPVTPGAQSALPTNTTPPTSTAPAIPVDLFFQWVDPLSASEGERVRLAGRDVYVRLGVGGNDQAACYARVVHRSRSLSDGQRAQEIVVIAVYATGPSPEQCQLARDFAAAVIPRLPPP